MRNHLALLLLAVLLSGCARAEITTEVRPDGSWNRVLEFHGSVPGQAQGGAEMALPKMEDSFSLPSGAEWTIRRSESSDGATYHAERSFKAGAVSTGDLVLLAKDHTPQVENEATVRKIGGNRWEYTEVFRWQGKAQGFDQSDVDPKAYDELRKALPPAVASDAVLRGLLQDMEVPLWHVLMGPPDPLLGQLLTHPEFVMHRIERDLGIALENGLKERLGNRLTVEQRRLVARQILSTGMSKVEATRNKLKERGNGAGGDDSALVALSVRVKLPGRVLETNGLQDDVNGVVLWGMFGQAPAVGEVVLRAVCEATPKAGFAAPVLARRR